MKKQTEMSVITGLGVNDGTPKIGVTKGLGVSNGAPKIGVTKGLGVSNGAPTSTITNKMKRILRILVGITLGIIPMLLATWIWLFDSNNETWSESVGKYTWYLVSGDWDELPE